MHSLAVQEEYNTIAKFLEAKGMPEEALEVATDSGEGSRWRCRWLATIIAGGGAAAGLQQLLWVGGCVHDSTVQCCAVLLSC